MNWIFLGALGLGLSYSALCGVVLCAMLAPPRRFGRFMKHVPAALIWSALPASRMWLWARRGSLLVGSEAPDFTLRGQGRLERVTLSSFRGKRPVVLVFGSYT